MMSMCIRMHFQRAFSVRMKAYRGIGMACHILRAMLHNRIRRWLQSAGVRSGRRGTGSCGAAPSPGCRALTDFSLQAFARRRSVRAAAVIVGRWAALVLWALRFLASLAAAAQATREERCLDATRCLATGEGGRRTWPSPEKGGCRTRPPTEQAERAESRYIEEEEG